jgi:hypothetical protein
MSNANGADATSSPRTHGTDVTTAFTEADKTDEARSLQSSREQAQTVPEGQRQSNVHHQHQLLMKSNTKKSEYIYPEWIRLKRQ